MKSEFLVLLIGVVVVSAAWIDSDYSLYDDEVMESSDEAVTIVDEGCTCVSRLMCKDPSLIKDGATSTYVRNSVRQCESDSQVCCKTDFIITTPLIKPTAVKSCGIRKKQEKSLDFAWSEEQEAQFAEFPWMMAVFTSGVDGEYVAGGSLIHPQVVLTAAHRVQGKGKHLLVKAGQYGNQNEDESFSTQEWKVVNVIIHERYNSDTLENDVALLILEAPVDMTQENVGLVCLPETDEDMDGRNCVVSGWDKDEFGNMGVPKVVLKKEDLPIVSKTRCEDSLRKAGMRSLKKLNDTMVCASGVSGVDVCEVYGGSPLVCPSKEDPEKYVQAGVVSWALECDTGAPGVYANVPHFVDWINSHINRLFGVKNYKLFTDEKVNWYQAIGLCFNQTMRLATIESEQEYQKLKNLIDIARSNMNDGSTDGVWLGGYAFGNEGRYRWMSTGKDDYRWISTGNSMNYSRWGPGQPDNYKGAEHCLELSYYCNYQMNDHKCLHTQYVACEY